MSNNGFIRPDLLVVMAGIVSLVLLALSSNCQVSAPQTNPDGRSFSDLIGGEDDDEEKEVPV